MPHSGLNRVFVFVCTGRCLIDSHWLCMLFSNISIVRGCILINILFLPWIRCSQFVMLSIYCRWAHLTSKRLRAKTPPACFDPLWICLTTKHNEFYLQLAQLVAYNKYTADRNSGDGATIVDYFLCKYTGATFIAASVTNVIAHPYRSRQSPVPAAATTTTTTTTTNAHWARSVVSGGIKSESRLAPLINFSILQTAL